jgi:hypothetical protein
MFCNRFHLDISKFIIQAVKEYLNPELNSQEISLSQQIQEVSQSQEIPRKKGSNNSKEKKYVNLVVKKFLLKAWDDFCAEHLIDRSVLILEATRCKLNTKRRLLPKHEYEIRIHQIVNNVIQEWGPIDLNDLRTIFEPLDYAELQNVLDWLESQNYIMRKGFDSYTATASSPTTPNFRNLIEYFSRVLEWIETEPTGERKEGESGIVANIQEIASLNRVIFDFQRLLIKNLGFSSNTQESEEILEQIRRLESAMQMIFGEAP